MLRNGREATTGLHMGTAEAGGDSKGKTLAVWLSIERLLHLGAMKTNSPVLERGWRNWNCPTFLAGMDNGDRWWVFKMLTNE